MHDVIDALRTITPVDIEDADTQQALFIPLEIVRGPSTKIAQLIRSLCVLEGVSLNEVKRGIDQYNRERREADPSCPLKTASNMERAITRDPPTLETVMQLFRCILKYDIEVMFVIHKDGKSVKYDYEGAMDKIAQLEQSLLIK